MIAIIDLGISNIKSITRGFMTQGFRVKTAMKAEDVKEAESLVLPGVGAFPKAVQVLKSTGLWKAIIDHVKKGKPLLGICLGMQLLFSGSEEHRLTDGLGLIPGHVVQFPPDRIVPHMGWNEVVQGEKSAVFKNIPDRADFYFVHSYYASPDDERYITGYSDNGGMFASAVQNKNVYGTQFHPEKSQNNGLLLLKNFAYITEK